MTVIKVDQKRKYELPDKTIAGEVRIVHEDTGKIKRVEIKPYTRYGIFLNILRKLINRD